MIYLILSGRIGNQLFMYAAAESIRKQLGDEDEIIINEKDVIDSDWINSLREYNLENVRFVNEDYLQYTHGFKLQHIIFRYYMD